MALRNEYGKCKKELEKKTGECGGLLVEKQKFKDEMNSHVIKVSFAVTSFC